MISPERGSFTLGPCAFAMSDGSHRTTEYRASSAAQSGSSAGDGGSLAMIAFRNPASSNAGFHDSMPLLMYGLSQFGVAGST
jgi:hypothetical protein